MRADCSASSQTLKVRCTRSITIRLNWSAVRVCVEVEHLAIGILADGLDLDVRMPVAADLDLAFSAASFSICRQ